MAGLGALIPRGAAPGLEAALSGLGVISPTEVQSRAVQMINPGLDDVLVVAQTGSGKTLIFLVPILLRLHRLECPPIQAGAPSPPDQSRRASADGVGTGAGDGDDAGGVASSDVDGHLQPPLRKRRRLEPPIGPAAATAKQTRGTHATREVASATDALEVVAWPPSGAEAGGGSGGAAVAEPEALVLVPTAELGLQHALLAQILSDSIQRGAAVACLGDTDAAVAGARVLVGTAAEAREALARRRIGPGRLRTVVVDEVDAVLCDVDPEAAALPVAARELLADLRPPCGAAPQFILTTAYLSRAHEAALATQFPRAVGVRQRQEPGAGRASVLVPTLRQRFYYFNPTLTTKETKLVSVLQDAAADAWLAEGTAMVFCAAEGTAAQLLELLAGALPETRPVALHAKLGHAERKRAMEAFRAESARLMICTGVAARGLDFPAVRHVVVYDMVDDDAVFIHCAGRTARRGHSGQVTCLIPARRGGRIGGTFQNVHALQPAAPLRFTTDRGGAQRRSDQPGPKIYD